MAKANDSTRTRGPQGPKRRTYCPPRIEQIDIVPQEALLSGSCKISNGGVGTTLICGVDYASCMGLGS